MTAPADYSNLYNRTRRPRSPQGDGAYDANGMAPSTGQQQGRGYNPQTSHPRAPQQQGQGFQANTPPGPGNVGGPQTFSQMQAQGQARPLPAQQAGPSSQTPTYQPSQQQNQLGNQLQHAVSQTLAAPTRYDMPQVQQVRDALTNQLQTQYAGQQKQINDQLASRGLLSSSIAGGYYGDLATNQANALADMNAKLIQDAAATNAADRSSALASGQNLSNSQSAQGIAGYNANLAGQNQAQQFGIQQGGLTGMYGGQQTLAGQAQAQQNAVQVGGLTGQYMAPGSTGAGQNTLGAQQLSQSGQQFAQNLALQSQLGQGNLGVAQQQANTGAAAQQAQAQQAQQQLNAQTQQFGQTYMLQQAAQNLNAQVQTGQLSLAQAQQQLAQLSNSQQYGLAQGSQGIAQQQANTQQQQVAGQLGLGQAQLAQSGQQFQQQYGLSQQQANTATAAQQAQAQYQQGQLGVAEKQVALQDAQFQQNFAQNVSQFGQTYALQKAASDLQNKVQLGQLDNQTAQQALAELSQKAQASQFTSGLNQNQTQFTQNLTAQQQQNAAQNAIQAGSLTGLYAGVTGYSANGQPIYGTPLATLASQQQTAQNAGLFGQGARYDAATGSYVGADNKPLTTLQAQQLAAQNTQNIAQNAIQAGQLTGSYNGAQTLGAAQIQQQGQQNAMSNNLGLAQLLNNAAGTFATTGGPYNANFMSQLYAALGLQNQGIVGSGNPNKNVTLIPQTTSNTTGTVGTTGTTGTTGTAGTTGITGGTGGDGPATDTRQSDVSQLGLTPEQLAQLQRMLGIGDAQMAPDF